MSSLSNSSHQDRLLRHLKTLLRNPAVPVKGLEGAGLDAPRLLESPIGDVQRVITDLSLLERRATVAAPTWKMLEAIVLPGLRPVLDIIDDGFEDPGSSFPQLQQRRVEVSRATPAVGRVSLIGIPGSKYGGTAFIVGPGLMMTNRHVAALFTTGVGRGKSLAFVPGRSAEVDLKQEVKPCKSVPLQVERVELIHPYWDMALLRVRGLTPGQPRLKLASSAPAKIEGHEVAVIGYPGLDPRNDIQVQMEVFRGIFERKRLQPGFLMEPRPVESYGRVVEALAHDCSTLGGNSGSCVLDVASGHVLGLHFAGQYLEANYAVPAWELARDARVVDCGVDFAPLRTPDAPPWSKLWGPDEVTPVAPTVGRSSLPAVEWYERLDEDALKMEWAGNRESTRARLKSSVGATEARLIIERLEEAQQEALFRRKPDPSLPEIVLLHGIMGAHLEVERGRLWLNVARIIGGEMASRLALKEDGVTDAWVGQNTRPGNHLKLKYGRAADAFRDEGFVVHEFSYDWRKSIERGADRLHLFLETLALDRPGRPRVLVAHSMGGLIASVYAQRHPGWRDRIERAIFMGSPLAGSYAPFEAILGTYPFFQKLARVSLRNSLDELRRAASTLTGLLDMLPDPSLFPDIAPLYSASAWPAGIVPDPRWLGQSLRLKKVIAESPILENTTLLASVRHGTVAQVVGTGQGLVPGPRTERGDGTVPARSAALPGVPAFLVSYEHSNLARDPSAINATMQLIRDGKCDLQPVTDAHRHGAIQTEAGVEAAVAAYDSVRAYDIQRRALEGELEGGDIDWLLSTSSSNDASGELLVPVLSAEPLELAPSVVIPGGPILGGFGGYRELAKSIESITEAASVPTALAPSPLEDSGYIEYAIEGPWNIGDPVHETLTLTALQSVVTPSPRTFQDIAEHIRGVIWNDDPEALLFNASGGSLNFTAGVVYAAKFKTYELRSKRESFGPGSSLLARSHFGDLQFLHAMAATDAEAPRQTLKRMLDWAEFCWWVALGEMPAGSRVSAAPVVSIVQLLVDHGMQTVQQLFHAPTDAVVRERALGSLLHMLQDSYAVGHVDREPRTEALERRGSIVKFHCYTHQDHDEHAGFDRWQGGRTTAEKLARLPGAVDAVEQSQQLLTQWKLRTPWRVVAENLVKGAWALAGSEAVEESLSAVGRLGH